MSRKIMRLFLIAYWFLFLMPPMVIETLWHESMTNSDLLKCLATIANNSVCYLFLLFCYFDNSLDQRKGGER